MTNLFDYLAWRGDLQFWQDGFQAVDALILSRLCYIPFDGIVPGPDSGEAITLAQAAAAYFALPADCRSELGSHHVLLQDDTKLLTALAAAPRFSALALCRYVNTIDQQKQEQFSAMTIQASGQPAFIAYRGTDDTIVGWKEDFNMCFVTPVPAQLDAVAYLEQTAQAIPGDLLLGGHSKGGNLAVYAAAFCSQEVQQRIRRVYNNDAPGFTQEILDKPEFQRLQPKVQSFVPQSSVVGMLLSHQGEYTVVHSKQVGLLQHDPFSWEVMSKDFICLETVDQEQEQDKLTP